MKGYAIVSAAEFEGEGLVEAFARAHIPAKQLTLGIGSLEAAKAAERVAQECTGHDIIFVGSCGSFADFSQPYLISTRRVIWSPPCERVGIAYSVQQTNPPITLAAPAPWLKTLPLKTIVGSATISMQAHAPKQEIAEDLVENLELYSCAKELSQAGRSLQVILCVTNSLNPKAHQDWKTNFKTGVSLTRKFICENLLQL